MNKHKPFKRLLSMAMSLLLVLGTVPLSALAQEADLSLGASGEITAFAELPEETVKQTVPLGTSLEALDLPATLAATVRVTEAATPTDSGDSDEEPQQELPADPEDDPADEGEPAGSPDTATPSDVRDDPDIGTEIEGGEQDEPDAPAELTIPVPVEWVSEPDYDGDTAATYTFTAEVEGYVVGAELPQITVTVQGEETPPQTGGEITAFVPMDDEIAAQSVPMGTPLSGLTLPGTLAATVDGEAASVPVTWDSEPEYNPGHEDERPGEYIFTAQLGENYTLADGVSAPQITVNTKIMPMLRAGAPIDITTLSIPDIKTAIENELTTENTVTVIGSKTGVNSSLSLDIPGGKTVVWAATFEADSGFPGSLIALPGNGTFEVTTGGTVSATTGIAIHATGTSSTVTVSGGVVTGAGGSGNYPVIYMSSTFNTGLNVTVSGTGKVKATANNGYAIRTSGGVEVKVSAEVSATDGYAIWADGTSSTVTVSGTGKVKATAYAILTSGNVEVKDSAEVSATTGTAIYATGTTSTVTVSGGVVTGAGSSLSYPVIYMSNISNTGLNVTISDTGKVKATADGGYAIRTSGSVEVKDSAEVSATADYGDAIYADGTNSTVTVSGGKVSATTGAAIYATGASSTVTVSGGTVSATTGRAVYAYGTSSTVTVSGTGKVKAIADGGYAICTSGSVEVKDSAEVSATTGIAIYADGTSATVTVNGGTVSATADNGYAISAFGASATVTVSGGTVSATTGTAIYAYGTSSAVTVSGGLVLAHRSAVTDVIYLPNNSSGFTNATGNGVVIAWNSGAAGTNPAYETGSSEHLATSPGDKAWWSVEGGKSGIRYGSTGFIAVDGVTVSPVGSTVDITGKNIATIQRQIEAALDTHNTVTVTGSKTGVSSSLSLDIPSGKTVVWAATFEANSGFSGDLIKLPGNGTFEATTGGTVSATTGCAIHTTGASSKVTVSGGTVSATTGYAIHATGASSTVTVSGGTVSATTGYAIYTTGTSSTVTVSGGTVTGAGSGVNYPVIYMSSTSNTGLNVTVSGTGKVSSTADGGYAIRTSGSVEVKNSAEVSATTGTAIRATGTSATVTVSGGTVSATADYGYAIYASGTNSTVTVSGTGKVSATATAGIAIGTSGSVEVKESAEVSATTGYAIRASGTSSTVTVSGGTVSATGGIAIYATGTSSTVTVSGTGKVKATADGGYAISTSGSVEVKDNAEVSATTGRAIYATGANSTVTVNGGVVTGAGSSANHPVIYMDNTSNIGLNVTVSGTGKVKATANGGCAIQTSGSVEVKDSAEVSATNGTTIRAIGTSSTVTGSATNDYAIYANGTSSTVTVSGGTVSATGSTGRAIYAIGTNSAVTVSSGTVSATGTFGTAIDATGTNSTVTVSGGTVSATTGWAIYARGTSATVTVSGGLVFAHRSSVTGDGNSVIYLSQNSSGFTGATGTGVSLHHK